MKADERIYIPPKRGRLPFPYLTHEERQAHTGRRLVSWAVILGTIGAALLWWVRG